MPTSRGGHDRIAEKICSEGDIVAAAHFFLSGDAVLQQLTH
jgi:hypothetical protein